MDVEPALSDHSSESSEKTKKMKAGLAKMHQVEQMIKLFMDIDENDDDIITKEELERNYKKLKIKEDEIDNWMKRFDADGDGKITLVEFCRGINMRVDDFKKQKEEWKTSTTLNDELKVIYCTLTPVRSKAVTDKYIELYNKFKDDKNNISQEGMDRLAAELKNFLDSQYGRAWQVVVLTGVYSLSLCHEPFLSMQFLYNNTICLAWKSHKG